MWRESEHYFFKLGNFTDVLRQWLEGGGARQPQVRAKLAEWFEAGLQDWDISRDAPYFGFEIPGAPGKYFYVWFDAPIGYLGSFKALCDKRGLSYDEYFRADSHDRALSLHRQGHQLLPQPVLARGAARRRLPQADQRVRARLPHRQRHQDVEVARHVHHREALSRARCRPSRCASTSPASSAPALDDIDLSLDDFVARVNSDIVGKLVNIASRCAGFVQRGGGKLAANCPIRSSTRSSRRCAAPSPTLYDARDYSAAHPRHHGARRSRQPVRRHA